MTDPSQPSPAPAAVETIDRASATGELGRIYEAIAGERGEVAHILLSHSLNPQALESHFALYRAIQLGPSPLPRMERELVATVVSRTNGCHY